MTPVNLMRKVPQIQLQNLKRTLKQQKLPFQNNRYCRIISVLNKYRIKMYKILCYKRTFSWTSLYMFIFKESSSSVAVSGICFNSGPLGTREVCFSYGDYTEHINFKVIAGIPAKLKLLSGPEMVKIKLTNHTIVGLQLKEKPASLLSFICRQPLQILNGTGISTPFVVQLCDEWENPSPDQRVVVETRASPSTVKVSWKASK